MQGYSASGGTSQLVGLAEYYAKLLKLPVVLGNPWKNVEYDPKLEERISELARRFPWRSDWLCMY